MFRSVRVAGLSLAVLAALPLYGCQKTSSTSSTVDVNKFVDITANPNPAIASTDTGGKTYRVVRGNNQPDDILPYQYVASSYVTITLNSHATDDNIKLAFPVKLTAATLKVQQASGGIVNPPTGTETEHYEYVSQATGNTFGAVNSSVGINFTAWYALPSGGKEALMTVTLSFVDDDSKTFTKDVQIQVAP